MITKLDIQEKDGFLTMKDFPMNCIFNKVKTGCGATTIALTNNENYIITVPTTELIENKCYPTKDADGNVKFWKKHERRAGLSPVVNNLSLIHISEPTRPLLITCLAYMEISP